MHRLQPAQGWVSFPPIQAVQVAPIAKVNALYQYILGVLGSLRSDQALPLCFYRPFGIISDSPYSENAASNARPDDLKSTRLVNSQASLAPCSRSMPLSSHSIDSGPS